MSELEVLDLPRDPLACVVPVVTRSETLTCPSISRANGDIESLLMRAENLEAILSIPLDLAGQRSAALSIMDTKPRIWSKRETAKLMKFASVLEF